MTDWNCDRSCTLISLPVWHSVVEIIYRNTRLISIIINSQLPLLSPHIFEEFSPEFHTCLSRHSTSELTGSRSNRSDLEGCTPRLLYYRMALSLVTPRSLKICECRTTPPRLVPLYKQPKMLSYCTVVYRKLSPRTSKQLVNLSCTWCCSNLVQLQQLLLHISPVITKRLHKKTLKGDCVT